MDKTINQMHWERILIDVSQWKKEYLQPRSVYCKDRFQNINHPLVVSGKAFWYDDNTLCIGYKLGGGAQSKPGRSDKSVPSRRDSCIPLDL